MKGWEFVEIIGFFHCIDNSIKSKSENTSKYKIKHLQHIIVFYRNDLLNILLMIIFLAKTIKNQIQKYHNISKCIGHIYRIIYLYTYLYQKTYKK